MHNVLDELIKKDETDAIRDNDIVDESDKKNEDAEATYVKTLEEISKISGVSLK